MKRVLLSFWSVTLLFSLYACSEEEYEGYFYNESYYQKSDYNAKSYYDEIKIVQWNIGHFSSGGSPTSSITSSDYNTKVDEYKQLISDLSADIISINEYSHYVGYDQNGNAQKTNLVLFENYLNQYIGKQKRYSCNALFSHLVIDNPVEMDFLSNQKAEITHTTYIKSTDYYFIESDICFNGIKAKLVTAHLAFDLNNEEVALSQIKEIIERYRGESHIILCGDWNIMEVSAFDLFSQAGYQMANHGQFGDFVTCGTGSVIDNIIVKGFDITSVQVIESTLSDHKPLTAVITISK